MKLNGERHSAEDNIGGALDLLLSGNIRYQGDHDMSLQRKKTAKTKPKPCAIIICCSDPRVVPEYIFSSCLGELFVVRTAGNTVSELELGSIEFGVLHFGIRLIIILGHSNCGAVAATLSKLDYGGYTQSLFDEISFGLGSQCEKRGAENRNIQHTRNRILSSNSIRDLVHKNELLLLCAKYDMESGCVTFSKDKRVKRSLPTK